MFHWDEMLTWWLPHANLNGNSSFILRRVFIFCTIFAYEVRITTNVPDHCYDLGVKSRYANSSFIKDGGCS